VKNKVKELSKITTSIYHITFHSEIRSVYLFFKNCNFRCVGCIRKLSSWDLHLDNELLSALEKMYGNNLDSLKTLTLHELESALSKIASYERVEAILGGGEPTVDPTLPEVLSILNKLSLVPRLLTNGFSLTKEIISLIKRMNGSIVISIKTVDKYLHKVYTGADIDPILRNLNLCNELGVDLMVETIYIPGLIESREIEEIASLISSINPEIPMRIDAYIPVPRAKWKSPSREQLDEALAVAKSLLKTVRVLYHQSKERGRVEVLWPPLKK